MLTLQSTSSQWPKTVKHTILQYIELRQLAALLHLLEVGGSPVGPLQPNGANKQRLRVGSKLLSDLSEQAP